MTTQIIPIYNGMIEGENTFLCDARDLHKFLGIGNVFTTWITYCINGLSWGVVPAARSDRYAAQHNQPPGKETQTKRHR